MKEHYCLGIYMDDGYMEHTCFFRDRCHCPYFYEREGIARQNNEDKMKIFLDG